MKKLILTFIAAFTSLFAFAISNEELLKSAEEQTAFYGRDFKANYSITQEKPGQGMSNTEAIMYRRDDEGKWVILVTGPEKEKGKGYLQYENTIWFYDPVDKRFTFTSAKDKFQGTNANNSDFTPQHYHRDYKIEKVDKVKLGKFDCALFTLKSKTDSVDYPMLKLWVTSDGLVRKKEDYSLSGQLLRTTAVPSYQKVTEGKRETFVPSKMVISDNLRGMKIGDKMQYERTQITVTNVSFAPQAATVYTKQYLEMMSAK
ncbi:MAG: outer membrane lipoprotein-sorting protein [Treponema sp.]|nr:outer membrane lipoprotein-sorting protein [Spirochaetia bacterium]MDD7460700.1 outer membrane lipoprotein-sorting protein [Spirochaetales bacterium]MDY5812516.1 outer membrane lipoprotein-sorting protein [Treponema sp.]MEE1180774.1 outer membrane lipoprotein-sorting protein [Treponema sp.]